MDALKIRTVSQNPCLNACVRFIQLIGQRSLIILKIKYGITSSNWHNGLMQTCLCIVAAILNHRCYAEDFVINSFFSIGCFHGTK